MNLETRIKVAQGLEPVDLLLKNGRLVNVLSGQIHSVSMAVHEGLVVGFGDYDANDTVDLQGRYLAPGFIDGHLHLESSMLTVSEFARNVVPKGTTTVVADPHEIANVMGLDGIRYMLDSSEGLPLRVYLMFPSCVPATPFETSGAVLEAEDMVPLKDNPRILGLAEMMNFPGVVMGDQGALAKIKAFEGRPIDGHAPGLSGRELCAYVIAGIGSDHECVSAEEAREKLGMGMRVMIREGSAAHNMDALLPLVNEFNSRNCMFVTDDMDPSDIMEKGHIDRLVRKAVGKGMDPIRAIQMASLNTARYFGLKGLGALAPGYIADILVLEDLTQFQVDRVYQAGRLVAQQGKAIDRTTSSVGAAFTTSMNVDWSKVTGFEIPAEGDSVNVIGIVPGEIFTKRLYQPAPKSDGRIVADTDRDILKISVIERHKGSGAYGLGLISGFGLKKGAVGCSVAHDAHNIIVVGENDRDMMTVARHIHDMGGGMAAAVEGNVKAELPLPIAGLMSDAPIGEVRTALDRVAQSARDLGCGLEGPFATLSFMALTPIPELKITDQGLFDSANFKFVSLFEDY